MKKKRGKLYRENTTYIQCDFLFCFSLANVKIDHFPSCQNGHYETN